MKISIITINYNDREGLKNTIESVVNQTYTNIEYVVIDGGSTDGGKAIIEHYKDRFHYWVSEPDQGIYDAMNKGLDHITGDYVLFLNSGDILYESKTIHNFVLYNRTEDLVCGDVIIRENGKEPKKKIMPDTLTFDNTLKFIVTHQAIFHKGYLFKEKRFDRKYALIADWVFYNEALLFENATYFHLDLCIVYYDGNGITSNKKIGRKLKEERIAYINEMLPRYLEPRVGKKIEISVCLPKKSWYQQNKRRIQNKVKNIFGKTDNHE
ncbi:MAG TPA: glycosyltransferase family 2 protein [Flavobacteriaceae bacterium]|nr:glycosyltransferase [Flavobacteriaceae bacterium]HPF12444.1 glycosyltransferase family 2 protein [Flavobacteriaceae bacterium]HQU21627.1 glycosyltransferase family 2 protein [Flavobacteriaceae bacterium]HQU66202.1 glycosyltransferase family 2 protein [Flavobacteriaceae bacterium]